MFTALLLSFLMQAPGAVAAPASLPPEAAPSIPAQRAQAWLTAMYPALKRGDANIAVYGDGVTTRLVVTAQAAHRLPGDATAPVLLVADLHRSRETGRLEALQVTGPIVQSGKLEALAIAIAAHPAWTATDVVAAIASAGGKFPPGTRAAMLAQVPAFGDMFGTAATVEQAAFVSATPAGPVWLIDVTVGTRGFRVAVEPFEGQVIGLVAR